MELSEAARRRPTNHMTVVPVDSEHSTALPTQLPSIPDDVRAVELPLSNADSPDCIVHTCPSLLRAAGRPAQLLIVLFVALIVFALIGSMLFSSQTFAVELFSRDLRSAVDPHYFRSLAVMQWQMWQYTEYTHVRRIDEAKALQTTLVEFSHTASIDMSCQYTSSAYLAEQLDLSYHGDVLPRANAELLLVQRQMPNCALLNVVRLVWTGIPVFVAVPYSSIIVHTIFSLLAAALLKRRLAERERQAVDSEASSAASTADWWRLQLPLLYLSGHYARGWHFRLPVAVCLLTDTAALAILLWGGRQLLVPHTGRSTALDFGSWFWPMWWLLWWTPHLALLVDTWKWRTYQAMVRRAQAEGGLPAKDDEREWEDIGALSQPQYSWKYPFVSLTFDFAKPAAKQLNISQPSRGVVQ